MSLTYKSAPEYKSIDAFVSFCTEDERTQFTHEDLQALNYRLRVPIHAIKRELERHELKLAERVVPKSVRGFTANSHDRWTGPGSNS